jgi:hypothetical protein
MPKKNDTPSADVERGFGTGLRVKLEGRREPTESVAPSEPADPEARVDAVVETESETELDEVSELEQLWTELEESLEREEQLKRTLEEQAQLYAETKELGRRLAKQAEALERRERALEKQLRALEAERAQPEASGPENARAYLRRRVEENGEALWRVLHESLTATKLNGQPDFRTRLVAAATILAEAYGEVARLSPGEQVAVAGDELAGMRAKRAAKPKQR